MRPRRRPAVAGAFSVGASFNDIYMRVATIYERAARLFRTLPEVRGFMLHQSAAFRQAAAGSPSDLDALRATVEAVLGATEHYLDEFERSRELLRSETIDLYFLHFPNGDLEEGWSTLAELKEQGLVRAIGVSNFTVAEMLRALEAGAQGYSLKTMPRKQLLDMIRRVHAGKKHIPPEVAARLAEHLSDEALSKREVDVLKRIAGGNRNSDIAALLFISEETVKGHVKHIMEKLGASDRTEAVAIGIRRGFIHL